MVSYQLTGAIPKSFVFPVYILLKKKAFQQMCLISVFHLLLRQLNKVFNIPGVSWNTNCLLTYSSFSIKWSYLYNIIIYY